MEEKHSPPDSETSRQRFSALMREHHRELLVFAGAATRDSEAARDIVQEGFVTAWRKFDSFDAERDFGAWMRGIVRNKTKDWFRRQQRVPISDSDLVDVELDIASWQASREDGNSVFDLVESCIGQLPAHFKSAIQSFYFEDRTGEEAAEFLTISPSNLRKRLERARLILHDCLTLHTQSQAQHQHEELHV